jgi:N-acetylglucosaminyldiphosphoundecaprenol N-acetyl-beta-D-mannosaminyltransferase
MMTALETNPTPFMRTEVLGVSYAELNYNQATEVITRWATLKQSETVVVAPVSSLIMAKRNPKLMNAIHHASMITSDGMPIVWMRKLMGKHEATRLYGPDLMKSVCSACASKGISVGLIGGHPDRMDALVSKLKESNPTIDIAYQESPDFRELSDHEVQMMATEARESGCGVIFVGMGCPKQEIFMQRIRHFFPGVLIGVGAAFDFIPGFVRQSPPMLQRLGLEWAFRLLCEPRRLWKRYASTIPPFLFLAAAQLIEHRFLNVTQDRGAKT